MIKYNRFFMHTVFMAASMVSVCHAEETNDAAPAAETASVEPAAVEPSAPEPAAVEPALVQILIVETPETAQPVETNKTTTTTAQILVRHAYPLTEFLAGGSLMFLKDVRVIGSFAHHTGVYLITAEALHNGNELAALASYAGGLSKAQGHLASATVLFLSAYRTHRSTEPHLPRDYANVFMRWAATEQIASAFKELHSLNSTSTSSEVLKIAIETSFVTLLLGPVFGGSNSFLAAMHDAAAITASFCGKDLIHATLKEQFAWSDSEAQFYSGALIATAASSLSKITRQSTTFGIVADTLAVASFFDIADPIKEYATKTTEQYFHPKVSALSPHLVNAALAIGIGALSDLTPQNRILNSAARGLRWRFVLESLTPIAKEVIPFLYDCTFIYLPTAYQAAKAYCLAKPLGKTPDEL